MEGFLNGGKVFILLKNGDVMPLIVVTAKLVEAEIGLPRRGHVVKQTQESFSIIMAGEQSSCHTTTIMASSLLQCIMETSDTCWINLIWSRIPG